MARELVIVGATRGYTLRHVGPMPEIWPTPPTLSPMLSMLNQSQMMSRPMPQSDVPGSPAFDSGQWTGRLLDAGDGNVVFPNSIAIDGVPWRDRFDSAGRNQWLEVYNDGYLEHVLCIMSVNKQQQSVQVIGNDGYTLTKNAYERDWVATQAPRDVIERATQLWMPLSVDNFAGAADGSAQLGGQWNLQAGNGGLVNGVSQTPVPLPINGGVPLYVPGSGSGGPGTISKTASSLVAGNIGGLSGPLTWTNLKYGMVSDGKYAVAFNHSTTTSFNTQPLQYTNFGYTQGSGGFPSSGSVTISGVVVRVRRTASGVVITSAVQLLKAGVLAGSNIMPVSNTELWVGGDTWVQYGSSSSLAPWGTTLTVTDVLNSGFGVVVQAQVGAGGYPFQAEVDAVQIIVYYTASAPPSPYAGIQSAPIPVTATGIWTATTDMQVSQGLTGLDALALTVNESTGAQQPGQGDTYLLACYGLKGASVFYMVPAGQTVSGANIISTSTPSPATSYSLTLESDGEWVFAFVNGQMIGCARRNSATTNSIQTYVYLASASSTTPASVTITTVYTKAMQPFLMQNTQSPPNMPAGYTVGPLPYADKGDYVLPGDITTYPVGGLHARYYNNADLANHINQISIIHAPTRGQAYGGASTVPEYMDQQDPTINGQAPPSGASASYWSAVWFGSIYLKLSQGNYGFSIVLPAMSRVGGVGAVVNAAPSTFNSTQRWWVVTGVNAAGEETALSAEVTATPTSAQTVTISWTSMGAGITYNVYRASTSGGEINPNSLISSGIAGTSFTDTGATPSSSAGAPTPPAVRVWIGKTQFGAQILDHWSQANTPGATYTFTVTQASLAGSLPYGGGQAFRDGYYPIKIEYLTSGVSSLTATIMGPAPAFNFTAAPSSYTDPGGTAITTSTVGGLAMPQPVPATSLSPLGMVDQRYQGQSHFDMAQQAAQAYGYQFSVEPYRMESGCFPGILAPRVREGQDSDITLEPDTGPRKEAILNYTSVEDATDAVGSLVGNGAGFQNGNTGQLQQQVYDPGTLAVSLFDVQGWQDFSDASFPSLLQALLNSQLSLRLQPWQLVSADPVARERLALGATVVFSSLVGSQLMTVNPTMRAMRYRPGDGVRLRARDISVWDTVPRQLLTVQRSFAPRGITGTAVGWANRPRGVTRQQRQLFNAVTRKQRSYQHELIALAGNHVDRVPIHANATSAHPSFVTLQPGDSVARASLRVTYNPLNLTFGVVINPTSTNTDATGNLHGPWNVVPFVLDLAGVDNPDANNQLSVALKNLGGVRGLFSYQLVVEVLR
jgi:hypothetical protein